MYRYCVDNAVTYTSEDFVLFRESPFACWMERLTLENPDHGIPPDSGSKPPQNYMERQDDLGDTLRAEGKNVYTVDWDEQEPVRRKETLGAMRRGVDFIVNGQLALGPLSGSANLLMRTSGYSELGNYLYIPCDTQAKTTLHSAFRLCFLADLLHSLQGQLPPQMLIIRGGTDLLPLQTEDHIYHYRAVKQRFMEAMRTFRKHRMPDPAESSHFGRWSDCANEVLKQRALRGEVPLAEEEALAPGQVPLEEEPVAQPVATEEPEIVAVAQAVGEAPQPRWMQGKGLAVSGTLADQAKMLRSGELSAQPGVHRGAADTALQNLEFIGRGGDSVAPPAHRRHPLDYADPLTPEEAAPSQLAPAVPLREEKMLPAERESTVPANLQAATQLAADTVDRDEVPTQVLNTDSTEFEVDCIDDSDYLLPCEPPSAPLHQSYLDQDEEFSERPVPAFSSSLNTSGTDQD